MRFLIAAASVLLLASAASAQEAIPIGRTVQASITDKDALVALTASGAERPADAYRLTLAAGESATVRMESAAFDTYLLVHLDGTFFARNDDFEGDLGASQLTLPATTEARTYTVYAGPFAANGTGSYTLSAAEAAPSEVAAMPAIRPAPLALGETASGTIAAGDARVPLTANDSARPVDAYRVRLEAGQTAVVRMESADFDTYLKVTRNGAFVARNDDFEGSRAVSQVTLSAPIAGDYTVFAGPFSEAGAGAYTIRAEARTNQTGQGAVIGPASGANGDVVQGTITDSDRAVPLPISDALRKADAYTVEARAGQRIVVEMTSTDFDTYLRIERDGVKVAHNDDAGSTSRSLVEYTVEQGGTHTIYAGTFSEAGRGAYTIQYRAE
ncbi:MAG: PPC domain-containing protein [Bacteroidota bacterium]